jgi:hypothetical protein
MTITRPAYCSRDDIARASDVALTSRAKREIDRALCGGADAVDALLNRTFYPVTQTKDFRWPPRAPQAPAWRFWIDDNAQLISLTSLTSGGTSVSTSNVYLEPQASGPPYNRVELNIGAATGFSVGTTPQRSLVITGRWGYREDVVSVGTLGASINASVTALTVSDSSAVGPGELLYIGTENMLVLDSSMTSTSQTLQTPLTAASSDNGVAVTTGSAYAVGEVIQLDTELMEITSITGNTLTVTRAVQGSVLAAHTGSTIYAPRSLTVQRAYGGTTAASHTQGDALTKLAPPPLVSQLNLAYAQTGYAESLGAYARPGGSGARTAPQPGAGVGSLEDQALDAYFRIVGPGAV